MGLGQCKDWVEDGFGSRMRTAIIGGGIAGMAAAYELEKAREAGAPVDYALYEATARLGGVLASETVDGAVLELGPDSFLTEKPAAAELCRELGLGEDLIGSNDAGRKTYIVVRNRLVPMPDGLTFLVPTKLIPTALTRLFSPLTKARMALELLHPPRRNGEEDESVAALVERHYGAEAVERLADPLLSGIYGGDAAQLSARTVLPRLVEMESEFGSLTRGMLAGHRKMRAKAKDAANGNGHAAFPRPAPQAIFTTLRGGMQQLVDALAARIDPAAVRLATPVSALTKLSDGWRLQAGGETEDYGSVIVASPSWAAGTLLGPVDAKLGEELGAIPYSSSITVNLIFDESKLGALPDGFGFLVPACENRALLACTFVHRKFLGRTPPGKAVLRAFLGGTKNESVLAESDAALIATVRRELGEILAGTGLAPQHGHSIEPEHAQVTRWPRAMAQYAVGHQQRMRRIAERVAGLGGLRLAGNAYDGIGISDCIRLGRQAASELVAESNANRVTILG
jgi:oxygen-dependent protoporphyrinogen oxidase